MKYSTKLFIGYIAVASLFSCDNFDEINKNPDAATQSSAPMLATNLILNIVKTGSSKGMVYGDILSKRLAWEGKEDYQYNLLGRTDFEGYNVLTNTVKMVETAAEQDKEAYTGLALFVKAYKMLYFSLEVGDIPYKEALKGEEGLLKPVYDTQKDVMLQILQDLEAAYTHFSQAETFAGDPIFKGNPENWKKTVTAFQLKVLINLSKKEADNDLQIKDRFARIAGSGSLMVSSEDNLQLTYSNKANQLYPFYYTINKQYGYAMHSTALINVLKQNKDYRLFYYAKPAKAKADEGIPADSFDAYMGVDPSDAINDILELFNSGQFSMVNSRYTHLPEGEPIMRLGYAEQNFILAEAATRGWIAGEASAYYKTGIEASFRFIGTHTPDNPEYHHGRKITDEVISSALTNASIQLNGNKEHDLEMILQQKYLASFFQHPYDSYYDYRRTGYPVLPINPSTNQNTVKDKIPVRWMYPQIEYDYNTENVNAAVARQYDGVDEVNKVMWILK